MQTCTRICTHEGAESPKVKQQSKYKKCDDGVDAVVLQSVMHLLKVVLLCLTYRQRMEKGHALPVGLQPAYINILIIQFMCVSVAYQCCTCNKNVFYF